MSNELPWWQQILCLAFGLMIYSEVALPFAWYIVRKAKEAKK